MAEKSGIVFLVLVTISAVSAQTQGRCGEQIVSGRILGGDNILRCTWPFTPLVSIKVYFSTLNSNNFGNVTICGGALINDQYVLTTAACVAPIYGERGASVRAGTRIIVGDFNTETVDFSNDGSPEDTIPVAGVVMHWAYNNYTLDNNIAIIQLAYPVTYSNCKMPACLLSASTHERCETPDVDETCTMASVGIRQQNPDVYSNIPQQAPLKMFSEYLTDYIVNASPGNSIPIGSVIGETYNSNVQTCLFDWGGIVVCEKDNIYWLRGLISTNNCIAVSGVPQPPIIITEVANYRYWIDSCVSNFNNCPSLPPF